MGRIFHYFLVVSLLITCLASKAIDNQLPQLQISNYHHHYQEHLNVTVGQQFTIILPQFDISKKPDDLKIYEITQEKFFKIFQTLETHNSDNQNKTEIIDKQIFQCQIKLPSMYISKTIDSISIKAAGYFDYNSQESMIYVPISTRSLLYTLDTSTMQVAVYHYTDKSLSMLSSAKIKMNGQDTQIKISMGSSSNEQYVYVFSSIGMWSIQTKTVLTNVKFLEDGLGQFKSSVNNVDKMIHGGYGYLFAISRNNAIYVIPEDNTQSNYSVINIFNHTKIVPQDIFLQARKIYVLDSHSGIFIYQILGSGQIKQEAMIQLQTYSNREILVRQNSIFVKYSDQQGHKIIQLNYDQDQRQAKLVRYYKSDQIIKSMSIQNALVSAQNKNSQSSMDSLLFLTSENGQIQVYPYNIDPRQILSIHNGPKMHLEGVQKIFNLYRNNYLIATPDRIIYGQISIQKPQLTCHLPESTGHIYYEIQFTTNISTCEHYDHTISHKKYFNSNCALKQSVVIFINDPELSRLQKVLLYGVVLLVVGGFIAGVLCLIHWRDSKLSLIGRIKDEILRFRDRQRKMQPFTQEENRRDEVQFELPDPVQLQSEQKA